MSSQLLRNIYKNTLLFFPPSSQSHHHHYLSSLQNRSIFTTSHLDGWVDKIKGVITGQKSEDQTSSSQSFTLLKFADELMTARKVGSFKQFVVGRGSEATFSEAFQKQEAIIRCLGGFDPSGDNLQSSHKKEAAKKCNCTIQDVENALAKFTWAKQAQKKIEKLKEEGKPMPKSLAEVQKLMGSTPMDLARSNLAKSGQISRNAPCPCGSKKLYKRMYLEIVKVRLKRDKILSDKLRRWSEDLVVRWYTRFHVKSVLRYVRVDSWLRFPRQKGYHHKINFDSFKVLRQG